MNVLFYYIKMCAKLSIAELALMSLTSVISLCVQLLAVFMQLGARELLMHYMDLKQTNDVQLTFEALKVPERYLMHWEGLDTPDWM